MKKFDFIDKLFLGFVIWGIAAITSLIILGFINVLNNRFSRYDVNQDGIVNTQDYVAVKNYIMGKEK